MTALQDARNIAEAAKKKGYAVRVKKGLLQFVTVVYSTNGKSAVTPHTDYMTPEDAKTLLAELS